ncbi:transporter substrate-binding domain-containing protein [Vibrio vulnificus]|uniref:substrate-binding periplasmic protein n=1 Tax=Vibrio vulnificus TaxID=672 RepID=UPI00102A3922|nr:transporter substrate-binding domain-containing protein [Vibrio vulnificus]EGQ7990765.1 transporter substrate-binding domain-containing protein [Vibrio vulnificus]EGR0106659.1 transporter substrate-binding domain-containing protein [Vibrio vulnificus]EGR7944005.1 transporter substrate-binding domain-containing protein [Vibrio vulnificus]EHU9451624.1 transporter substrate-binding domain-containing protein [Vibrio vulnificus]EHV9837642.1 transporter substrate-binding domain-containing protein
MFIQFSIRWVTATILSMGVITLAHSKIEMATFEFPPYSMQGIDDRPVGAFVEIVNDVCVQLGSGCEIGYWPNRRAKILVNRGQAAAIFPMGWNKQRVSRYFFSVPIIVSEYGFFINKDAMQPIKSLRDLQGLKVAVFGPSNTFSSLSTLQQEMVHLGYKPFDIAEQTDASEKLIHLLHKNRVDAYYSNRDVGEFKAEALGLDNITYSFNHREILYFIAFSKNYVSQDFIRRFNRSLLNYMVTNPNYYSILSKYQLSPAPVTDEILDTYNILR